MAVHFTISLYNSLGEIKPYNGNNWHAFVYELREKALLITLVKNV